MKPVQVVKGMGRRNNQSTKIRSDNNGIMIMIIIRSGDLIRIYIQQLGTRSIKENIPRSKSQPTPCYAPKRQYTLVLHTGRQHPKPFPQSDFGILGMFVQEFLRFVDLSGQIWASAPVRVVEEHQLAMLLAHLILGESSFTV